jgi:hypothetical protein
VGPGSINRDPEPSEQKIQLLKKLNLLTFFHFFVGHFCSPGFGSTTLSETNVYSANILFYRPRLIRSKHLVNQEAGSLNLLAELPHTPRPSLTRNPQLCLIVFARDTDFFLYESRSFRALCADDDALCFVFLS